MNLSKAKSWWNGRNSKEEGNDIVITLFALPIVVALLFGIVEVSTYFQTKTQVQNIARDGARAVALNGGASANISLNKERYGGNGTNINNYVMSKLVDGQGNCTISSCRQPPVVRCTPDIARNLSSDARCQITYYYGGVVGPLINIIGLNQIVENTIVANETFKVETAWSVN